MLTRGSDPDPQAAAPDRPAIYRCVVAGGSTVSPVPPDEAVERLVAAVQSPDTLHGRKFVWLDISHPGEAEAELLRDRLGLHHLAVEDTLRGRQRPKIERYPSYFFVVFYALKLKKSGRRRLGLQEIHLFVGEHFLITVHDRELPHVDEITASWAAHPKRVRDTGAAAHALFDAIVDGYFPVVEHFSDRLNQLEEQIFSGSASGDVLSIVDLRHELILMRRLISPEREIINSLLRRDLPFLRPEYIPYFQDVYDHLQRLTEEIDTFRDIVTGLLEVQSSVASNRLNQTVQTLTAWSIILMSIAVVAGIYGMNFEHMPELELPFGYYGALVLMLAVGAGLAGFFRRRGWL